MFLEGNARFRETETYRQQASRLREAVVVIQCNRKKKNRTD